MLSAVVPVLGLAAEWKVDEKVIPFARSSSDIYIYLMRSGENWVVTDGFSDVLGRTEPVSADQVPEVERVVVNRETGYVALSIPVLGKKGCRGTAVNMQSTQVKEIACT